MLRIASVDQPWCVEDANLGKMLGLSTTSDMPGTYYYAILAFKLVQAGRVGLTPVEDTEVVVITPVGDKDIGEEFQN